MRKKSDLDIGNIITEIDGNKVTSLESIRKVLDKKQKGDKQNNTDDGTYKRPFAEINRLFVGFNKDYLCPRYCHNN